MPVEKLFLILAAGLLVTAGAILFFVYQYWCLPRRVRLRTLRLRRAEAAGKPPSPHDYQCAITLDAIGFTVVKLRRKEQASVSLHWPEIERVIAFKRDMLTFDCICLNFARGDGSGIEVDEEMSGWKALVEALPQHLPGCKSWDDWFSTVALPAFATKATEIYASKTVEKTDAAAGLDVSGR